PQLGPLAAVVEHLRRVHEGEFNPGGRRPDLRLGRDEIALRQDLLRLADHEVIKQHCRMRMGGAAGDRHAGRQGNDWRQILVTARVCATRALHLSACALPALPSYSLREQLRQGDTNTWCSCSAEKR